MSIITEAVASIVALITEAADATATASRRTTEACRQALAAYCGTFGTELAAAPADPKGARKVADKILNGVKAGLIEEAPASAREEWDSLTWREAKAKYGSRDVHEFESPYTAVLYSRLNTWTTYSTSIRRIVKGMHAEDAEARSAARDLVSEWVEDATVSTFNGLLTAVKDLESERRGPRHPKGPDASKDADASEDAADASDDTVALVEERQKRAKAAADAADAPEADPIETVEDLRSALDSIVERCTSEVLIRAVAAFVPTKTARRRFANFLNVDPDTVEEAAD